jgi:hypothetical protein
MGSIDGRGAMEMTTPINAVAKLVELLTPLPSDDRLRTIQAAMILLGESQSGVTERAEKTTHEENVELDALPARARTWMRQNGISAAQLHQVFHISEGAVEVIAGVPGKNRKEQTYNAYILTGLGQFLLTGNPTFQDKPARAFCESSGCYDSANHSVHIRKRGREFTGSKEKGWTLTAPGLQRAAEIVKQLSEKN